MSDKNSWTGMCAEIQDRSLSNTSLFEVKNTKALWAEISKCLIFASDEKILDTPQYEINGLLKIGEPPKDIVELLRVGEGSKFKQTDYYVITVGKKNQKHRQDIPHFKLNNGCWFDFTILISEVSKPSQILGFNFEIRFPEKFSPSFLRFDLNPPNHKNNVGNMRFHLHPSNETIMLHSPPMSPLEILHMFLYGIEIPDKSRATRS